MDTDGVEDLILKRNTDPKITIGSALITFEDKTKFKDDITITSHIGISEANIGTRGTNDPNLHRCPITILKSPAANNTQLGNGDRTFFGAGSTLESHSSGQRSWSARASIYCYDAVVSRSHIVAQNGAFGSDDPIKSEEELIGSAALTLLKLKPKNYFKHPLYRVDVDDEAPIPTHDLSGEVIEKWWESGLIAQEVAEIPELQHLIGEMPEFENETDTLTMNYTGLIPYLIKSNQELNERIKQLENK